MTLHFTDKRKSTSVTETRLSAKIDSCDQVEIHSRKGDALETTTSQKLLGVYIDQDLAFNERVEHLGKNLQRTLVS